MGLHDQPWEAVRAFVLGHCPPDYVPEGYSPSGDTVRSCQQALSAARASSDVDLTVMLQVRAIAQFLLDAGHSFDAAPAACGQKRSAAAVKARPKKPKSSRAQEMKDRAVALLDRKPDGPSPGGWFDPQPPGEYNEVTCSQFAAKASSEYSKWVTPTVNSVKDTTAKNFVKWIKAVPTEVLDEMLAQVPTGTSSYDFTLMQRLVLVTWFFAPFDRSACVDVSAEDTWKLSYSTRKRKHGIGASTTLLSHMAPRKTLLDLFVGSGKTALSCTMAYMLLSDKNWPRFEKNYHQNMMGTMFGSSPNGLRRVMLVVAPGATHNHFQTTISGLIPVWESMGTNIRVWINLKEPKAKTPYSLADAASHELTVWIVSANQVNVVLKQEPDLVPAVVIWDEYCVNTPKTHGTVPMSELYYELYLQATPFALEAATQGHKSPLQDILGKLISPRDLKHHIERSNWTAAALAAKQWTMLMMMRLWYLRYLVIEDMAELMPKGFRSMTSVTKFRTFIAGVDPSNDCDTVPADFTNVLLKLLYRAYRSVSCDRLPAATIDEVHALRSDPVIDAGKVLAVLDKLAFDPSSQPPLWARRGRTDKAIIEDLPQVKQLRNRFADVAECPVCFDKLEEVYLCSTCSQMFCPKCAQRMATCGMCRAPIQTQISLPSTHMLRPVNCDAWPTGVDLPALMKQVLSPQQTQLQQLVVCLCMARHFNLRNVLVFVKRSMAVASDKALADAMPIEEISRLSGTRVLTCRVQGRGTKFAAAKAQFDANTTDQMALMCDGCDEQIVVGSDFTNVHMVVTTGSTHESFMVQLCGRFLRPGAAHRGFVHVINLRCSR